MWVLLESLLTKQQGKKLYFKGWTKDGPATTDDLQEAHRFESAEAARLSAAYRHKTSFFEVKEVHVVVSESKAAA